MSRSHFTIEGSWPSFTIATLFNPVFAHDHLSHGGHVEHVLAVVLLGEVDVVEEEGEVFEHPLGKVKHFKKKLSLLCSTLARCIWMGVPMRKHTWNTVSPTWEHLSTLVGKDACSIFQGKKYRR